MDDDIKKAAKAAIIRMKAEERRLEEWIIRQGLKRENGPKVTRGISDLIQDNK